MKTHKIEKIKGTDNTDCLLVDGRYQIYLDNGCIYDTEGAGDIPQYVFDIRDRAIHKFTDEEVIKALEVCVDNSSCKECPINPNHGNYGYCTNLALTYALDLIKRQKAEIELLKEATTNTINTSIEFGLDKEGRIEKAKAEAVKEFAEKLKERKIQPEFPWDDFYVTEGMIDEIVEELTGDLPCTCQLKAEKQTLTKNKKVV